MKKANQITSLLPWMICSVTALFYSYEYFLRIAPSVMTNELTCFFYMNKGALGNLYKLLKFKRDILC